MEGFYITLVYSEHFVNYFHSQITNKGQIKSRSKCPTFQKWPNCAINILFTQMARHDYFKPSFHELTVQDAVNILIFRVFQEDIRMFYSMSRYVIYVTVQNWVMNFIIFKSAQPLRKKEIFTFFRTRLNWITMHDLFQSKSDFQFKCWHNGNLPVSDFSHNCQHLL